MSTVPAIWPSRSRLSDPLGHPAQKVTPGVSVGVDVTSVERISQLVQRRPAFATKLFTAEEVSYCAGRPERLAARWAAKEAVRKVYGGLGLPIPPYPTISVTHRPGGAPTALVGGEAVPGLELSLSHDAGLAIAMAVLVPPLAGVHLGDLPAAVVLPQRSQSANKGTFGTVLVVAGSPSFPGAAVLCARGALRGGAGKVKVIVAEGSSGEGLSPEVIRFPVPVAAGGYGAAAAAALAGEMDAARAVVCGPGLGETPSTHDLLAGILGNMAGKGERLVLDADALNAISRWTDLRPLVPGGCVLTPHPLEAARLGSARVDEVQADRRGFATNLAGAFSACVVLKGAGTVVAEPGGALWTDGHSTSALATGGTGDVLAGLIGALVAQGSSPADAARAGVFLHAEAGSWLGRARGRAGVLASEVADALVEVQEAVRRRQGGTDES